MIMVRDEKQQNGVCVCVYVCVHTRARVLNLIIF